MGNMAEQPVQAVEHRMVEIKVSNNVVTEQSTQQQCGDSEQNNNNNNQYLAKRNKSLRVRYIYGIIFLITNFVAWFFRDYGEEARPLLHCKSRFLFPSRVYIYISVCVYSSSFIETELLVH